MIKPILLSVFIWFLIGAVLLSAIVYFVYRTGIVHSARDKDGTLRRKQTLRGILAISGMLLLILLFLFLFDYFTFRDFNSITFSQVVISNFTLILLLVLFDSFFIDIFVLGKWKPGFLNIPEELTLKSMKYHVKKQFTAGWLFTIPIVLISAILYCEIR